MSALQRLKRKSPLPKLGEPDAGLSEFYLGRHRLTVLVAEVAVGFHRQSSAVFVAQPARHSWDVNARFNATRGKQVA